MNQEAKSVLERLEDGRLDLEDAEVKAALERFPELSAEVEGLRAMRSLLDETLGVPDEVLRGDSDGSDAERDRALVEAAAPVTRRGRRAWAPLAAAALVALMGLLAWRLTGQSEPDPFLGGSARVGAVAPIGDTPPEDWGRFEWTAPDDPGSYSVVVVRPTPGGDPIRSPKLNSSPWEMSGANNYTTLEWWIEWYVDSSASPERSSVRQASRSD